MYCLKLKLNKTPVSLNKKLRSHYFKNHAESKSWDSLIFYHVKDLLPPEPLVKAEIIIVRHGSRMLDYDGLVGSLKPVVDALVSYGVLSDDSWKVIGAWKVDQKFRPKKEGPLLEIEIQALPSNNAS